MRAVNTRVDYACIETLELTTRVEYALIANTCTDYACILINRVEYLGI
jgi:hypothetical protein